MRSGIQVEKLPLSTGKKKKSDVSKTRKVFNDGRFSSFGQTHLLKISKNAGRNFFLKF